MKNIKLTLQILVSLTLFACAPKKSPKLMGQAQNATALTETFDSFKVEYNPKVDILFVIDNSGSMRQHIENLSKNIDKFVDSFDPNQSLDFHIGVISVYDSDTFHRDNFLPKLEKRLKARNGNLSQAQLQREAAERLYPEGQLRPVKNAKGEILDGPAYITPNTPNFDQALRSTLKLKPISVSGPVYEELFIPAQKALADVALTGAGGPNEGFRRNDANLAVILITDSDDKNAQLGPGGFDRFLRGLKLPGMAVSSYAMVSPSDVSSCAKDRNEIGGKVTKPVNIETSMSLNRGQVFNICENKSGEKLAQIGSDIREKITPPTVVLSHHPDINQPVSVTYVTHDETGSEVRLAIADEGWKYDSDRKAVILVGADQYRSNDAAAYFEVTYTPANLVNVINGRTQVLGQ